MGFRDLALGPCTSQEGHNGLNQTPTYYVVQHKINAQEPASPIYGVISTVSCFSTTANKLTKKQNGIINPNNDAFEVTMDIA
jgi:regulator of RNase E activity RraA